MFPLGGMEKTEVREIAKKPDLLLQTKKIALGFVSLAKETLSNF